jgi:hypothetical protein
MYLPVTEQQRQRLCSFLEAASEDINKAGFDYYSYEEARRTIYHAMPSPEDAR